MDKIFFHMENIFIDMVESFYHIKWTFLQFEEKIHGIVLMVQHMGIITNFYYTWSI